MGRGGRQQERPPLTAECQLRLFVQRLARDAGLSGRPEMVAALRYPLKGRLSTLPLSATTSISGLSVAAVFTGAAQKVMTTGSARFFSMARSEKPATRR